jgi:hypothetical protein
MQQLANIRTLTVTANRCPERPFTWSPRSPFISGAAIHYVD